MEKYRKTLKKQNLVMAICILILLTVTVLGFVAEAGLVELTPQAGDSHWQSKWRGFMSGAAMGVLGLMLFGLIRNLNAMKDEKKLRKLYNQMHDERTIQLFHNARSAAMTVFLIVGLMAVIVTGYFNITVSVTILACVLFCSVISMGFKLYYDKKY